MELENTEIVECVCKIVYIIKEIGRDLNWVIIFEYS